MHLCCNVNWVELKDTDNKSFKGAFILILTKTEQPITSTQTEIYP